MTNELAALSNELAAAVERAGRTVVAVHARPRFSSSGMFWRPGVIVTAEHTIRREDEITVTLPDGKADGTALPSTSRSAEPVPGNLALSIGSSQDSGVNATLGIVSAVSGAWRTWRGGRLDHYIRLDLTLYPGSSGGAVINTAGETIGIATSALSRIAGVAIPAATVDRVVDELLTRGHVSRGYLGLGLQPVELPDRRKGLIVLSIEPEGPSAKAGLLIGEYILGIPQAGSGESRRWKPEPEPWAPFSVASEPALALFIAFFGDTCHPERLLSGA